MEQPSNITILSAFGDNYICLAEYAPGRALAVDPGDAGIVHKELDRQALQLTHIFVTHHHMDHVGGIGKLKQQTDCTVIGPDRARINGLNTVIDDNDLLELEGTVIRCISTPGHTATSVCYYVSGDLFSTAALFTGDTLFVCGCGRMLECDGRTMYGSMQKLAILPEETHMYAGHNYTEENVRFALTIRPDDKALQEKLQTVLHQIHHGQPTIPSVLEEEKKLNPFLLAGDWKTFSSLRQKKDIF